MNPKKIYVKVLAEHLPDGRCRPLSITWADGRIFEVDKILDVCRTASLKAGGWGIRYTCRIRGQERYLFDEGSKWFVEGK